MGGNIGDVSQSLASARTALTELAEGELTQSLIYETAPWGLTKQAAFLNQVVGFVPKGSPQATLLGLQAIERAHGRKREKKWGPRTLDLDLLCWPGRVVNTLDLVLPHPGLSARRFVLEPWADVAADLVPAGLDRTVRELLAGCTDSGWVRRCS
jgi:2-amino-4-hydroxy-6-hydroxymethyldihydropteridine diphosphokinase